MRIRTAFRVAVCTLALLVCGSPLVAQVPEVELDPEFPVALESIVNGALEAPGVSVTSGERTIATADTVAGPVAHFGGTLMVEGRVRGDVTAVGSEVTLRPGAAIEGNLRVIGGALYGTTMADIAGTRIWLREETVSVTESAGRLHVDYEPPPGPKFPIEPKGFAGVVIHTYNGVDGLSFGLEAGLRERRDGPRTELAGGPVFRSDRDDVGWRVAGLRDLPRVGGITVGGAAYRVTTTPEAWHRGDRGNGLASLFFADDDRTYHERTGYELWIEKAFPLEGLTLRGSWRDDDFESLDSVEPFAFFGDDEDWRVNPPVDEGSGRALAARVTWERRDDPKFPVRGIWAEAQIEHWGFGSDFEFDWAQGQVRAYRPIPTTAGSFVGLRVVGGGRLGGGDTLAPQFLYRLGGGSTIIGYEALTPILTGDRMAFVTATVHQALFGEKNRWYLVGLASVGDAWLPDEDPEANAGFGGGIAIHGKIRYAGVFGVYGVEEEKWRVYTRLTPWF